LGNFPRSWEESELNHMTSLAGVTISHKNFLTQTSHIASPGGFTVSRESLHLQQQFCWMQVRAECQTLKPLFLQSCLKIIFLWMMSWQIKVLLDFCFKSIKNKVPQVKQ
jgi:hypothetical protein